MQATVVTSVPDGLKPVNQAIRALIPGNIDPSTQYRWIVKGVAGLNGKRIRLRVWYVGRKAHSTTDAVKEWLEAVTAARLARMQQTHQRAADVSDAELEAVGLK